MSLKNKLHMVRITRMFTHMRLSVRLTIAYGAVMAIVIVFIVFLTAGGVYYMMYHQAEVEMGATMRHVVQLIDRDGNTTVIGKIPPAAEEHGSDPKLPHVRILNKVPIDSIMPSDTDALPMPMQAARQSVQDQTGVQGDGTPDDVTKVDPTSVLMPGVILRVTDALGNVVYETDHYYPSIERVESNISSRQPLFAKRGGLTISSVHNMDIAYRTLDIEYDGERYTLHFFRTITAEKRFMESMENWLLVIALLALAISLVTGYFVSLRMLRPIRTVTKAARDIEISNLGQRIDVPPVKDELTELIKTFNMMLDRIQIGFEQQKRFVSDASHELRTPITVIRGYSDLLSRWGRSDPEVLDEGIASIRSEAEDMQHLIERLLFLARADQKRQVLHKELIDMNEVVGDVARKMKLIAKQEVTLLKNDHGMVVADSATMREMLRIFLENAMKYTPESGHITISSIAAKDGSSLEIRISDDGIGIAKDNQKKIFERFFRVDSSRVKTNSEKKSSGGTGLGLSIAKWIADQHSIDIGVDSDLGKGTTFILTVPVSK